MAEDKKAAPKAEEKKAQAVDQSSELEELKKQLEEAKAVAAKADEAALEKISKMVGLDAASIKAVEAMEAEKAKANAQIMECDLGSHVVYVNGMEYKGVVRGPSTFIEVLVSLAGNAQNRKLEEKIGKNKEVIALASGGVSTRMIGVSPESLGV